MARVLRFGVLLCALYPAAASAHPLGDAAAAMRPGEWRELSTDNMSPTMDTTNGGVPEYGDNGAWDPGTDRFYIHGQGHEGGTGQFRVVQFDAEANRWDALPQPAWYGGYAHQISHPYDHNAVDPDTGIYYMRPFSWNRVYSYDAASDAWGELPAIPDWGEYERCCGGLVHFPEMGALVLAATGEVVAYDIAGGSWSRIGAATMGGYHNFAEYLPGAGVVVLGGGPGDGGAAGARTIHRLDPDGSLTQLEQAPLALGTTATVTTADPVSGTMLVLADGGTMHAYDVATDAWGIESEDAPLPVFNTVAAPLPDHGVIFFANWDTGDPGVVYLYKMSPFVPPPDDDTGGEATGSGEGSTGGVATTPGSSADGSSGTAAEDSANATTAGSAESSEGGAASEPGAEGAGGQASGCGCRTPGSLPCSSWLVFGVVAVAGRRRRCARA